MKTASACALPAVQIITNLNGEAIFTTTAPTFRAALEKAAAAGVNLQNADLRRRNLGNAMLDGATLAGADFSFANLTGANLSEADLRGARFAEAALYNTCLAYAMLQNTDFSGASFGAADIAGADLRGARFTTLSCFTLDFHLAKALLGAHYINPCGAHAPMSKTPLVIKGLQEPVIFLDEHIKIGPALYDRARWQARLKAAGAA